MNKQSGFTLIELMIVVAIIAILAAIALPQYNKYTQRSANAACLAEAKAFMSTAVADVANDSTATASHTGKACTGTVTVTNAQYNGGSNISFTTPTKGDTGVKRDVSCNAGSGACDYAASAGT